MSKYSPQGIGQMLMETVLPQLKNDGVGETWLGTAVDNRPAQALFAKAGGIRTGETFYDYTYILGNSSFTT